MNKVYILVLCFIIVSFSACDKNNPIEDTTQKEAWNLIWSDEFNGSSIDQNLWEISETPKGITARTSRNQNLRIENGLLIMELHKEEYDGKHFTGSEIKSRGAILYGKFECRAKLPSASRAWPAFWTLGKFQNYGEWPNSGEVDIIEYWGYSDPQIFINIHTKHSNWENNIDRQNHSKSFSLPDARDEFHVYTMEWYSDHMNFLLDGQLYWTYNKLDGNWEQWPFDKPMLVLLQLYATNDWTGSDSDLPAQFEIDYVRVYELVT